MRLYFLCFCLNYFRLYSYSVLFPFSFNMNRVDVGAHTKLIKVLMTVMPSDGMKIFNFMEDFKKHLTSHDKEHLMKPFLSAIINLCQTLLKEDGTPRNTLPNK